MTRRFSHKLSIGTIILATAISTTSCIDDPEGECNTRDYPRLQRLDQPSDSDSDSGSAGRNEQPATAADGNHASGQES